VVTIVSISSKDD